MTIPSNFEETLEQAKEATKRAFQDGYTRVQIELVIPEIALEAQNLALQFTSLFEDYGAGLKVIFPDTGASALARRDWGETVFKVTDLGSPRTPIEMKVSDEDQAFLVVCPSAVEVAQVEKLCNLAVDRPVLLLIPQLEDVSIVGIGYSARQLRERFISTLTSSYYFRPLDNAIVLRSYPSLWQVWLQKEEGYELISEESQKPLGENLDRILMSAMTSENTEENPSNTANPKLKAKSFLGNLQSFLRALSQ